MKTKYLSIIVIICALLLSAIIYWVNQEDCISPWDKKPPYITEKTYFNSKKYITYTTSTINKNTEAQSIYELSENILNNSYKTNGKLQDEYINNIDANLFKKIDIGSYQYGEEEVLQGNAYEQIEIDIESMSIYKDKAIVNYRYKYCCFDKKTNKSISSSSNKDNGFPCKLYYQKNKDGIWFIKNCFIPI